MLAGPRTPSELHGLGGTDRQVACEDRLEWERAAAASELVDQKHRKCEWWSATYGKCAVLARLSV